MIKKRFITSLEKRLADSQEIIDNALAEKFADGNYPNTYEFRIVLTAQEVRMGYVQGLVSAELASEYDIFKKKKTIIRYQMNKDKLISILVEDEY
jgi:hypothetical protein